MFGVNGSCSDFVRIILEGCLAGSLAGVPGEGRLGSESFRSFDFSSQTERTWLSLNGKRVNGKSYKHVKKGKSRESN